MSPEHLAQLFSRAITDASTSGALALDDPEGFEVKVERPRDRAHGDWSTNIAMQIAKSAQLPPRDVARVVLDHLTAEGIESADIAGPGFINVTLAPAAIGELARTIVEQGPDFGRGDTLQGISVNIEFVSANPTGPNHLGGTRWAAVGDSLARLLEFHGAKVTREYYFNDHGAQIDRFAASLLARARSAPIPEDGYAGQYIDDIAAAVREAAKNENQPDPASLPDDEAHEVFRSRGVALMFDEIKDSLHNFGVDFDVYFHENSLHESGKVETALTELKASGALYENDSAWWLRSSDYGDEKDRVVLKSDGVPAYIAGDIAYVRDKHERGADLCIYVLGADHHGYVARLTAAAVALGYEASSVEVIIGQLVSLVREGAPVRMSKRAGTVVSMEDLVDAVGVDAARYGLARSSVDTPLDLDLDVLSKATNANPVFYVQYAHARAVNVARNASEYSMARGEEFDPALLVHDSETLLLGVLAEFPSVVAQAVEFREQHRVARYLESLAAAFHGWYDRCRVTPQGDEVVGAVHIARLWLNDASRQVFATGLHLLGVSAPERM